MPAAPVSFPELFFKQVERRKDRVALRHKEYGIWKRISWSQYGKQVQEVAAGLIALGLEPGNRVAILGDNRPEWLICHLAAMSAGGVTCGVYPTSAAEQVAYVVGHSESKILFVENEEQVDKVLQILPDLDLAQVVIWDPKGLWGFSHPKLIFFDEFRTASTRKAQRRPGDRQQASRSDSTGRHGHDYLHFGNHRPAQRGHDHASQYIDGD